MSQFSQNYDVASLISNQSQDDNHRHVAHNFIPQIGYVAMIEQTVNHDDVFGESQQEEQAEEEQQQCLETEEEEEHYEDESMFSREMFIERLRLYPGCWDPTSKLYKNRTTRVNAWEELAQASKQSGKFYIYLRGKFL